VIEQPDAVGFLYRGGRTGEEGREGGCAENERSVNWGLLCGLICSDDMRTGIVNELDGAALAQLDWPGVVAAIEQDEVRIHGRSEET
jgi:hypothetical protein